MQTAPIPKDEAERLGSLGDLKILDTPPEERFDRITRLAARVFGVPISTVSLVDANREWFKSVCGLDQREGDRAVSFCGHAMLADDMLVIPDAKADARFADNPMVVGEPFIRFYAGVPLSAADGKRVGTLCVKGREPREVTPAERETLKDLAKWAELELNSRNLSVALEEARRLTLELDAFFDTSRDLMCIAGVDGFFSRVNPSFERLLGYSAAEFLGAPFFDFVHPEDLAATKAEVGKLSGGAQAVGFENRFRKKSGGYVWLQWGATPRGQKIYATARDVTLSREREEILARLNAAMVGRELKMVELKAENERLRKLGGEKV